MEPVVECAIGCSGNGITQEPGSALVMYALSVMGSLLFMILVVPLLVVAGAAVALWRLRPTSRRRALAAGPLAAASLLLVNLWSAGYGVVPYLCLAVGVGVWGALLWDPAGVAAPAPPAGEPSAAGLEPPPA